MHIYRHIYFISVLREEILLWAGFSETAKEDELWREGWQDSENADKDSASSLLV